MPFWSLGVLVALIPQTPPTHTHTAQLFLVTSTLHSPRCPCLWLAFYPQETFSSITLGAVISSFLFPFFFIQLWNLRSKNKIDPITKRECLYACFLLSLYQHVSKRGDAARAGPSSMPHCLRIQDPQHLPCSLCTIGQLKAICHTEVVKSYHTQLKFLK